MSDTFRYWPPDLMERLVTLQDLQRRQVREAKRVEAIADEILWAGHLVMRAKLAAKAYALEALLTHLIDGMEEEAEDWP